MHITPKNVSTVAERAIDNIAKPINESLHKSSEATTTLADGMVSFGNICRGILNSTRLNSEKLINKHEQFFYNSKYSNGLREYLSTLTDEAQSELADLDDIMTLVETGKLNKKILQNFTKDSKLPKLISEDLAKLRNSKKSLIDTFIPEIPKNGDTSQIKVGDVFHKENSKFIHIKTEHGAEELNIDKQTYFKLFPPVTRYANIQNNLGNCYEITALNSLMMNPKTRVTFLKCFQQKGNDIIVKFPNPALKNGVKFTKGELPRNTNADHYSLGADGFKLVEYAFGKELEKEFLDYQITNLKNSTSKKDQQRASSLEKLIKDNNFNGLSKEFGGDNHKTLGTELREGNFATVVWSKFGLKENGFVYTKEIPEETNFERTIDDWSYLKKHFTGEDITDKKLLKKLITNKDFFDNHLVECSALSKSTPSKFLQSHSMMLRPVIDKSGEIKSYTITDPHGIISEKVKADEIFDNIDSITYAHI